MAIASPRRIDGRTRVKESYFVGTGATVMIAPYNGDRISLVMGVTNALTCNVSTLASVDSSHGMAIGSQTVPLQLTMAEHAGLVCQAWYAFIAAGLTGLAVIETIYLEEPEVTSDQ